MADTIVNTSGVDVSDDNKKPEVKAEQSYRRSICRYGPGCTHKNDPNHKEKFWHPSLPKLNGNLTSCDPSINFRHFVDR